MTAYPAQLLDAIKASARRSESHPREKLTLPSDATLELLFDVSFHASMQTEEGRRPGFRLILLSPDSVSKKESFHEFTHPRTITFAEPRPFTIAEIVRLAPAAEMHRSLICVHDVASDNGSPELQIWGLLDVGTNWWEFVHHAASGGQPPPAGLTITSSMAGELSLSSQGLVHVRLRKGAIIQPTGNALWNGEISDFLDPARQALYVDACRELNTDKWDNEGHDNDYPQRSFTYFLERILFNIRDLQHGGTLIVVRDEITPTDSRLTDRVFMKYQCENSYAWSLLVADLVNHRRYYDLYFPLSDGVDLTVERFREMHRLEADEDELNQAVSDVAQSIAALAAVDGAVVMTDRFRVLGFGAEVVAQSQSLTDVLLPDRSGQIPIDNFGTRHRSAFRFCSSFEDAVAFVLSQDGGVKAVKRSGAHVLFWPDINEGMLGI